MRSKKFSINNFSYKLTFEPAYSGIERKKEDLMIITHKGISPKLHASVFVAPSADIIGDVAIGQDSSVWFQAVIRGDLEIIRIGQRSNIQDHATIHTTRKLSKVIIGDDVSIGHRALLHGCQIGNRVLIGMGAIVMDNVVIGDDCLIGAGTLLTKDTIIPPRSLVLGSPGKVIRELKAGELQLLINSAQNYMGDVIEYKND